MTYRHILVPTDGSEISERAVEQAVSLAAALGARLRVLHVQVSFPISLVGVGELVEPSTVDALMAATQQRAETILGEAMARAAEALTAAAGHLRAPIQTELAAAQARSGLDALGEIVGRIDNERMLDKLFASFCIGK